MSSYIMCMLFIRCAHYFIWAYLCWFWLREGWHFWWAVGVSLLGMCMTDGNATKIFTTQAAQDGYRQIPPPADSWRYCRNACWVVYLSGLAAGACYCASSPLFTWLWAWLRQQWPELIGTDPVTRFVGYVFVNGIWTAFVASFSYNFLHWWYIALVVSAIHRRGRQMYNGKQLPQATTGIPWGGRRIPYDTERPHMCVVGVTGAGKSLTINMVLNEVIPRIQPGSDRRAVIYDPKTDVVPQLYGLRPACPIYIMNPLDARSHSWDIAADCANVATMKQISGHLVPQQPQESQAYFNNVARDFTEGVIRSYHEVAPGQWTLRDLLLAFRDPQLLRQLFERCPSKRHLLRHFEPITTFENCLSQTINVLDRFEPIAALWEHAQQRISLEKFVREEAILVLGQNESVRFVLDVINRFLFHRLSEMLLSQPDSRSRETLVFLDELREMGRLDGLRPLLTMGRSKGCRLLLGFQDIQGMQAVYGADESREILGMCANKALLRMESPETADWASKVLGEEERLEYLRGKIAAGKFSGEEDLHEQLSKREVMLASEFMQLPYPSQNDGLTGVYLTAEHGAWSSTLTGDEVTALLPRRHPRASAFIPRPAEHQHLQPWNDADYQRLQLKPPRTNKGLLNRPKSP
jgi:Type IV secretion-system coupling protein DNA-binding domain